MVDGNQIQADEKRLYELSHSISDGLELIIQQRTQDYLGSVADGDKKKQLTDLILGPDSTDGLETLFEQKGLFLYVQEMELFNKYLNHYLENHLDEECASKIVDGLEEGFATEKQGVDFLLGFKDKVKPGPLPDYLGSLDAKEFFPQVADMFRSITLLADGIKKIDETNDDKRLSSLIDDFMETYSLSTELATSLLSLDESTQNTVISSISDSKKIDLSIIQDESLRQMLEQVNTKYLQENGSTEQQIPESTASEKKPIEQPSTASEQRQKNQQNDDKEPEIKRDDNTTDDAIKPNSTKNVQKPTTPSFKLPSVGQNTKKVPPSTQTETQDIPSLTIDKTEEQKEDANKIELLMPKGYENADLPDEFRAAIALLHSLGLKHMFPKDNPNVWNEHADEFHDLLVELECADLFEELSFNNGNPVLDRSYSEHFSNLLKNTGMLEDSKAQQMQTKSFA